MASRSHVLVAVDRDASAATIVEIALAWAATQPPVTLHAISVVGDGRLGDDFAERQRWLDALLEQVTDAAGVPDLAPGAAGAIPGAPGVIPGAPGDVAIDREVRIGDPDVQIAFVASQLEVDLVVVGSSSAVVPLIEKICAPVLCVRPKSWRAHKGLDDDGAIGAASAAEPKPDHHDNTA